MSTAPFCVRCDKRIPDDFIKGFKQSFTSKDGKYIEYLPLSFLGVYSCSCGYQNKVSAMDKGWEKDYGGFVLFEIT